MAYWNHLQINRGRISSVSNANDSTISGSQNEPSTGKLSACAVRIGTKDCSG